MELTIGTNLETTMVAFLQQNDQLVLLCFRAS